VVVFSDIKAQELLTKDLTFYIKLNGKSFFSLLYFIKTARAFYVSWLIICIFWCFLVIVLFWRTLVVKNMRKSRNIAQTGSTTSATTTNHITSNGTEATSATAQNASNRSGSKSGGQEASSKIQQHSQKLIQKAVIRIAW
jgi:hypothetical protein